MAGIIYISAVTGLSPSVQLYSGAATEGASFSATEIGSTGEYIASVPSGIPYGYYLAVALVGSNVKIASGDLYWDGAKEISPIMYEELNRIQGLNASKPSTVTPTTWDAGDIHIDISGDGTTTTTMERT